MRLSCSRILAPPMFAFLLLASGCGGDQVTAPGPSPGPAPDFHLEDVNSGSATHGVRISPRQYLGKVSAYYFGHAT